jgi:hypothetical protein
MRTTLTLDDDVAAMLQRAQKKSDANFKEIVNEALREGLQHMIQPPATRKPFRTKAVDLGKCSFPNLDNVWEVLAEAEGTSHK